MFNQKRYFFFGIPPSNNNIYNIIKPYDQGACSASFPMCKINLMDPLHRSTDCLATTGDG
jgi:hypothetical protein